MKKVILLAVAIIIFGMAGCKSAIQVHGNMYDALGGQVIKVSDDFKYVGSFDPTFMWSAERGRPKSGGVKTRGDVFVKSVNGQPSEVFIVQRASFTLTGWSWNPPSGDPVVFYGKQFRESFFDAKVGDESVESYMEFLKSNGYTIDVPDLYVRAMTRTIGQQTLASLYYGVYPGLIPEDQRGDGDKERQFIRERFAANVSAVQ